MKTITRNKKIQYKIISVNTLTEEEQLQLAIQLSLKPDESEEEQLQLAIQLSLKPDESEEEQLQRALRLSLEPDTDSPFDQLSAELILHIFNLVQQASKEPTVLHTLSRVCTDWRDLVWTNKLNDVLQDPKVTLSTTEGLTFEQQFINLVPYYQGRQLTIEDIDSIGNRGIEHIAQNPNIRSIRLANLENVTDTGITRLLTKLKELNRELNELHLNDLPNASTENNIELAMALAQTETLHTLSIKSIKLDNLFLDTLLNAGFRHSIKHIVLLNAIEFTSAQSLFKDIFQQFPNLETLAINCNQSFFHDISKEHDSLIKLDLINSVYNKSESIRSLHFLNYCPNLKDLSIKIDIDEHFQPIFEMPRQKTYASVTALRIETNNYQTTNQENQSTFKDAILIFFPNLRTLKVNGVTF